MNKRPLTVTVIGWLYIVVGIVGFSYHFTELDPRHPLQGETIWIELVRLLALVAGMFMLWGQNWARWLAIAWIAFHVVVSALNSMEGFAMHAVICALLTYALLRRDANTYFRGLDKSHRTQA